MSSYFYPSHLLFENKIVSKKQTKNINPQGVYYSKETVGLIMSLICSKSLHTIPIVNGIKNKLLMLVFKSAYDLPTYLFIYH